MPGQEKKNDMNTSLAPADSTIASDTTTPTVYLPQQPIASIRAVNDGRWRHWPQTLRNTVARAVRSLRSLGPYVAIEVLLPGGSIIALALWIYRRRRARLDPAGTASTAVVPAARSAPLRCLAPCTQR